MNNSPRTITVFDDHEYTFGYENYKGQYKEFEKDEVKMVRTTETSVNGNISKRGVVIGVNGIFSPTGPRSQTQNFFGPNSLDETLEFINEIHKVIPELTRVEVKSGILLVDLSSVVMIGYEPVKDSKSWKVTYSPKGVVTQTEYFDSKEDAIKFKAQFV